MSMLSVAARSAMFRFAGAARIGFALACGCLGWSVALLAPNRARADNLLYPLAVAAASDARLYVADRDLPGVWLLAGEPKVFFQGQKKFRTPLNAPRCVAFDEHGRLLAGDSATRDVYRFDDAGQPTPLTGGRIGIPMDIAVAPWGELFVSDLETQRLWRVPGAGGMPREFAAHPAPRGLCLDKQGGLWVVSGGATPLARYALIGPEPAGDRPNAVPADDAKAEPQPKPPPQPKPESGSDPMSESMPAAKPAVEPIVRERLFQFPHDVAVDDAGNAYVTDGYGAAVWKVAPGQPPVKLVEGGSLRNPVGIAHAAGELFVADSKAGLVLRIDLRREPPRAVEWKPPSR